MNAGQEAAAKNMLHIYRTIIEIMDEDYDAWIRMNNADLMKEVMHRTCGVHNPTIINNIIQRL